MVPGAGIERSPTRSSLLTLGVPFEARLISHSLDRSDSIPALGLQCDIRMVPGAGIEPATLSLEGSCSIP